MDMLKTFVEEMPYEVKLGIFILVVIAIVFKIIRADEIKVFGLVLKRSRKSSVPLSNEDPKQPNPELEKKVPRRLLWFGIVPLILVVITLVGFLFLPWKSTDNTSQDPLSSEVMEPMMKEIPAGDFYMGSPPSEKGRDSDEGRYHKVTIARSFEVSIYEITFNEWDACVDAGGCNGYRPDDNGWGRGKRPVINVSWNDARAYVEWLSDRTGKEYRLLSESEWEYVARAGTVTRYWWGDKVGSNRANCRVCGSLWDGAETGPVGSFKANPFGLYDVHGNVYEWVEDCWHGSYKNAPTDGSAWGSDDGGDCSWRVVRGGSWFDFPEILRSAGRGRFTSGIRSSSGGFRIARTLP